MTKYEAALILEIKTIRLLLEALVGNIEQKLEDIEGAHKEGEGVHPVSPAVHTED